MKSGDEPAAAAQANNNNVPKEFILGFKNLTDFSNEGLRRITEATRAFQSLPPSGPLWDLQKSFPEFSRAMRNSRTRIMPIMKTVLEHVQVSTTDFKRRDMEEKLDFIIEANDDVLERVGRSLDEADGLFKRTEMVIVNKGAKVPARPPGTWGKKKGGQDHTGGDFRDATVDISRKSAIISLSVGEIGERKIKKAVHRFRVSEKPQLKFSTPVDNSLSPFVPKLKFKPNSLKPLSVLPEYTATNEEFFGHPYELELGRWQPEDSMLVKVTPRQPRILEETPLMLVTTPAELEQMMKELEVATEIAVDLEHHSFRTFLGLTCLIQISTREKDYIIDALSLRDDLEILNDVFTRPKIVKVFHGASSDIEWLQRDFGVYVVGLFDTFAAMKQLSFQQFSLQALLAHYCGVSLDKKFQLADWRIRPLPADMLEYARRDTHWLLYAYDMLKNELIENGNELNNLLTSVFAQSQLIAARRYEKPGNNPQLALRKTRRSLNNRQVHAFTELYKWRDTKGREKDESLGFVLPNHMLLSIAETLPKEMTGILACCEPVPQLVHLHLGEIHRFVLQARDLPLHRVEKLLERNVDKRKKMKNWMLMMNSIHDADVGGDEEDMSLDPKHVRSDDGSIRSVGQTWPEVYKEPPGWQHLKVSRTPVMAFGRSRIVGPERTNAQISCPFRRYQMSNEILEKLKKPEAERNLDMADPLVRVVSETIAPEATVDKPLSTTNQPQIYKPAQVLDNKEFVAFNPMATKPKPKKQKGGRQSPSLLDQSDSHNPNEGSSRISSRNIADFANGEEDDGDDGDMEVFGTPATSFVPVSKSKKAKKNKKKKQKFLNKVKDLALGRNKRKRKDAGDDEEAQDQDHDEPVAKVSRVEAEAPEQGKGRGWGRGKKGRGGSFDGRGRGQGRSPGGVSRNEEQKGGRQGDSGRGRGRGRGGTGFLNPFRRREAEGRSITFK